VFVDAAVVQVISAADEQRIHPFTGFSPDGSASWSAWSPPTGVPT